MSTQIQVGKCYWLLQNHSANAIAMIISVNTDAGSVGMETIWESGRAEYLIEPLVEIRNFLDLSRNVSADDLQKVKDQATANFLKRRDAISVA